MAVASNSSPLIYLAALSDFDLLRELFGQLVIPPAVYEEVVERGVGYPVQEAVQHCLGDWIRVEPLSGTELRDTLIHQRGLQVGESEVIALATSLRVGTVLMDDRDAVACARALGLRVIRTPLIYNEAKNRGRIANVRAKLDELRSAGFRLSDRDYQAILKSLGEL